MARGRARLGYGVKAPYLDFGEVVDVARRIYEEAAGSVSEDQLSSILGNTVGSSSFRLKLLALKAFGVVTQEGLGKRIKIAELGQKVVAPTTPEDRVKGLKEAFLRIDTYRVLFELWAGKILPTDEFFLNTLRTRCHIPAELTKRWQESFMHSADAAGLFQERSDGRIQLRLEPTEKAEIAEEVVLASEQVQETHRVERSIPSLPSRVGSPGVGVERFSIPLLDGRIGALELPSGWTEADIRKLLRVVNAMFLWSEGPGDQT